jgi:SOS-response transcriptional repressor LexA
VARRPTGLAALTPRQRRVYDAIRDHMRDNDGQAPTVRELARDLSFASANAVTVHLRVLVKKGVLVRLGRTSRGLRLAARAAPRPEFVDNRVQLDCGDRVYTLGLDAARAFARAILAITG